MAEQLQLLRDLQELDQQKLVIDQQRQKGAGEKDQLQGDVDRLQGMVDLLAGDIEALKVAKRELKIALDQEQENVSRSEGRLPQIKTQKEYVAVLKEVDMAKKLSKEVETQIAAKDESLASLNADKAEKDEELGGLTEQADARRAEVDKELAVFDKKLAAMTGQRDALMKDLPTSLRKRYDLLISRRAGVAVVEARSGACLGCNMHLPPQLFNSLLVKKDEVQACPLCNRLLYVEDQS